MLDAGIVVSGPADVLLVFLAWRLGRRLYARLGLLEIQPWERGDEGLRVGRLRLIQGLWRDAVAGTILVAAALELLHVQVATPMEEGLVAAVTAVALPLYLGATFSMMARLTGIARQSSWTLEGIILKGRLPSPWTPVTRRAAVAIALTLALLAASPLLGALHNLALWTATTVLMWFVPLVLAFFSLFTAGLRPPPVALWPPARFVPPATALPPDAPQSGASLLVSLVVILVLSWVIWWALVKLLDRLPAVAAVARARPGHTLLGALLAWLRGWWKRGRTYAASEVEAWQARRAVRRVARAEAELHDLAPRAVVMVLYRRTLRRAGSAGWPRPPAQTPREFAARVGASAPADRSLDDLTAAFEEARYSHHEIPPAQAQQAEQLWRQVRRLLRRR
jgi:hypothetical protein